MAYRLRYADIQAEAPLDAKAREREILQRAIELLRAAKGPGADPLLAVEAAHFTSRIWTAFLADLAGPDNQLAPEIRAGLISIGIWILKEIDTNRANDTASFEEIISITEIIRDGLQ